ncbi:aspartate/glutamate racemase family protein [candidate division KSB1 bacterium]
MKTIGMIGGMSWESTLEYYRVVNERVKARLGGSHSAQCIIYSVEFAEVERMQYEERWDKLTGMMTDNARALESAGADCIVICTNTMHLMADDVGQAVDIPLLHIADATAERIKTAGMRKVGLLGTKFTMEKSFYKDRLKERHGIDVVTPGNLDRSIINEIIYKEFVTGSMKPSSKQEYVRVINSLAGAGAEGIVLGCTEIPLFITQEDSPVPLFDTTTIHAEAAVEFALGPA